MARARKTEPSTLGPAVWSGLATAGALAASGACAAGRGLSLLLRAPDVHRVAAGLLLAAGLASCSEAVRADLAGWPRFRVARGALATTPLPAGLSERARRDLERVPLPDDASSALDPHLVPAVAARLATLAWVREVEEVRLSGEARLTFSLVAREPVARLDEAGALTRDGWVIPLEYAADAAKLPAITGLPPASDVAARRRALDAALGVLDDLAELRPRVRVVDVKNLGGGADRLASEVTLVLDDGLVVEWGRAPEVDATDASGRPRPGRATTDAARRRRALASFLERGLERGPDRAIVARVSVRWDEVTYALKPTPAPVAAAPPR